PSALQEQILDFFRGRLKSLWSEEHDAEVIEAVLNAGFDDLVSARQRLLAVYAMLGDAAFRSLAEGFSRTNIVEKADGLLGGDVDPALFEKPVEGALYESLLAAQKQVASDLLSGDYARALQALTALRQPLDTFFTEVMVMAEEANFGDNHL